MRTVWSYRRFLLLQVVIGHRELFITLARGPRLSQYFSQFSGSFRKTQEGAIGRWSRESWDILPRSHWWLWWFSKSEFCRLLWGSSFCLSPISYFHSYDFTLPWLCHCKVTSLEVFFRDPWKSDHHINYFLLLLPVFKMNSLLQIGRRPLPVRSDHRHVLASAVPSSQCDKGAIFM